MEISIPFYTYIKEIDVEGILTTFFNLMKRKADDMTETDRLCVLSFDECNTGNEWSYDKRTDTLYSPKNKVQCVLVSGLVKSWKQLI